MALTDTALTRIKDLIASGELSPGQRLPPENELSAMLGLSRNSLREAVKALELINVLEVKRGNGTFVAQLTGEQLREAIGFVVEIHASNSIEEILAVRRILEAQSAYLAASRITDDQLATLRRTIEETDEDSIDSLVENDIEFHRTIADAAGNSYLAGILDAVSVNTRRARTWRGLTQTGAIASTIEEHRTIVSALESRDPDTARAAMTVHLAGLEQWVSHAGDTPDQD
ncbi:FadR/GntR family transcriptional regulator [Brevibacterium senegalense]|uniref:FadR/GntR family transcriptional regulator n=1 Tax=Brevibacterium senegalense TaxID=1033736 RepID=UPI00030F2EFB|nr:FadR/GntR family transcriptional regulator [Brevibacterium senegalense]